VSEELEMAAKRVLSGMQASGLMHLGNFHGALENWVRLQAEYECFFFIADWHALTTLYDQPGSIRDNTAAFGIDLLAGGLDPERCTLFLQSDVLQHAELAQLLGMITPVPWLERVPSYKDKKRELAGRDLSSFGFLGYPVLQAADIAVYQADCVPVGEDQLPHLELTREIVRRFNHLYGETLIEPQALMTRTRALPGLDGRKMSKSYGNAIYLADDDETVRKKLMGMVTDPQRQRRSDGGRPEVCNIFALHRLYTGGERLRQIDSDCRTAGIGCVDCKKELIAHFFETFGEIRERRRELVAKPQHVRQVLDAGAERARVEAEATMERVREAMKLGWRP
jgi:tryptophanyl-tRNA synthetase